MPKVLVTGGAGFIGAAVAKKLLSRGFEVRTFDLVKPDKIVGEFMLGTIMYPEEIYQALQGCDYVVHLAAMLGVDRTEKDKLGCLNVNIEGSKNIFDACAKTKIKKVIFSSSSEVYGEPRSNSGHISETDPVSPKSVYGVSKLAGEEYLKAYAKRYGFKYSIVRFFNVYGPGQIAQFVMPRFIKFAQMGIPPQIYGNGNQIRSFCHAEDAAEGVFQVLASEKADGETFNIGNAEACISMRDLAYKAIKLSNKEITPQFVPIEKSDRTNDREIVYRMPDISKAKTILNYSPKISLDEGMLDLINDGNFKDNWVGEMRLGVI